jgi:signal transduction histidine kinase
MTKGNSSQDFPPASLCSGKNTLKLALMALAYFLTHELAFFFPDSAKIIMAIWPAGGIGLAALLLNPRRQWPVILPVLFISGLAADLLAHRGFLLSAGFMTANILESLGCAWLILRRCGENVRFTRMKEVLTLIVAATGVNACTALIGAGTAAFVSHASFLGFWKTWWVADGLGILLVTPLIVAWASLSGSFLAGLRSSRTLEVGISMVLWCAVAWVLFQSNGRFFSWVLQPCMLMPLVLWFALRFEQRAVMTALFALAVIAIPGASMKAGSFPWFAHDSVGYLLDTQIFLGIIASAGMLIFSVHAERKQAKKALVKLMDEKSRFAITVSHELRSPLAAIKGATELVWEGLAGPVNDEQKNLLHVAKDNIERLNRLINNVLVFQKTQAGKTACDFRENDLDAVIRETLGSAALFAGNRSADLVLESGKDFPKINFDKDKIFQVLLNLVSNALKYSQKGRIVIQARHEGNEMHVSVLDLGSGIKADYLKEIFEPFSQAGNDRKGGTGLGLAIAREIVLAHHGRIWAESEEGKGSTFHFTLPL